MRIAIVGPAPPGSRLGNRVTAERWQHMLVELGHAAEVVDEAAPKHDLLVALHAKKSAHVIADSRARFPQRPIVVALTGTDLYRDILVDDAARRSLELADLLVVLHDLAPLDVPLEVRHKVRVVRQSAEPTSGASPPTHASTSFDVAFVAHARAEKDPLRAASAARALAATSRLRIVHAGRALSADMEAMLRREMSENPRYVWLGELGTSEARSLVARSKLLVLTSTMEGGANVLGEAIVDGVPPVASRISACIAALGEDYPALFAVGDTEALTRLFAKAEGDAAFYERIAEGARERRHLFAPSAERDAWQSILDELKA